MRLFTGLDLPDDVVGALEDLLRRLKPAANIRWSPPSNLHITTKFIGHLPGERLDELKRALAALPSREPIPIAIRRLGFFPNPRSPRVFWCGIDAPGLEALAADTDDATAALGVGREDRAFSPHLTLARIKERIDMRPLNDAIASIADPEFGSFQARSFFLYESARSRAGSVYTKLAEFPLTKA